MGKINFTGAHDSRIEREQISLTFRSPMTTVIVSWDCGESNNVNYLNSSDALNK